jgi:uncharacterized protein (DUF952 family)
MLVLTQSLLPVELRCNGGPAWKEARRKGQYFPGPIHKSSGTQSSSAVKQVSTLAV